jgi:uncharacterized protein YxjI
VEVKPCQVEHGENNAKRNGQSLVGGGTATRYRMRQKLVAFGDDFWIENEAGQRAFKVDGKMLRVRDTLFFEDMQGQTLCKIQEKLLRIKIR